MTDLAKLLDRLCLTYDQRVASPAHGRAYNEARSAVEAYVAGLEKALRDLEVMANTVRYCYDKRPENFAVALRELGETAKRARTALAAHDTPEGE